MAIQLLEGQTFSADYSLLHRLTEDDFADRWLAFDTATSERVFLKVFKQPLATEVRHSMSAVIERSRGLLHHSISRPLEFGQVEIDSEPYDYLCTQYIQNGQPFTFTGDFNAQWTTLKQVIEALRYADSLGFNHGRLHPNNILIKPDGEVCLTDFGLPNWQTAADTDFLSPQAQQGHKCDRSDDMYSLGQLLHQCLTGKTYRDGQSFETDQPLPDSLKALILSMLAYTPLDRPRDYSTIIETIENYTAGIEDTSALSSTAFTRAEPPAQQAAPGSSEPLLQSSRHQQTVSTTPVLIALAILVVVAGGFFWLLPSDTPVRPASDTSASAPSPASHQTTSTSPKSADSEDSIEEVLPPLEVARLARVKEESQELANQVLRLQVEVEDIGGLIWAADDYNRSQELGIAGDEAYRDQSWDTAHGLYNEAVSVLQAVLDRADQVFNETMTIAYEALENGEAQAAVEAFTILNAINPDDPDIRTGLRRAENLEEVLSLVRNGEVQENNGDLNDALATFQQAATLDKAWQPATAGVTRVKNKLAQQAFNVEMSKAFQALEEKSYEAAREAFAAAQKIRPDSREPQDGLQQVDLAETRDILDGHRKTAMEHEAAGDWPAAIKEYNAILAISPGTTFAVEGLKFAEERKALLDEMDTFIQQPGLMVEDDKLAEAKTLLITASRAQNAGSDLKTRIGQLSHLISLARIPVEVSLISDNKTDVVVYRVKDFGKFESTTLSLYPGTYTIVGKRKGYRDVQEQISIRGGKPGPTINVSCTEKI